MAANALPLQEERQLFARENNQALTALTFLSSRFEDLSEANVLSQCEMQEALKSIDQMVEAVFVLVFPQSGQIVVESILRCIC